MLVLRVVSSCFQTFDLAIVLMPLAETDSLPHLFPIVLLLFFLLFQGVCPRLTHTSVYILCVSKQGHLCNNSNY